MDKSVFLILLFVVTVTIGYEDWQRQRSRDNRKQSRKVIEVEDGELSLGRRHRGRRHDVEGFTKGRRHRFRGRQDSDEIVDDDSHESLRAYHRKGRHEHRLQRYKEDERSHWQRFLRRLHDARHNAWSFDVLPDITGHIEFGPGFTFDWDLDIDGLFEGDIEWWKGPNVCVREEVHQVNTTFDDIEGGTRIFRHQFFTQVSCDATDSAYICTTEMGLRDRKSKTTKIYECCHGFERDENSPGCTRVLELSSVLETAERLGGAEFVEALESTGLKPVLDVGNFTVFLPVNSSLDDILPKRLPGKGMDANVVIVSPETLSMATSMRKAVAGHIVDGFMRSSSFSDEMLIETENSESSIRINLYSTPISLVTANCRVVTSTDHLATNGVVHTLLEPLPVVSGSIWDIIRKDPRLSTLFSLLERTRVDNILKDAGQLTLIAPTNEAFIEMDKDQRQRLLRSDGCMKNVLTNHVLPNVICSSVIKGQTRSDNLLRKSLNFTRTESGDLLVEGVLMTSVDIMATNGVIHVVDQVVVPDDAKSIQEVVDKHGHSKYFHLVHEAGLSKGFSALDNITIFVPTDEAIRDLPDDVFDGVSGDTEALAKLLKYHVVPSEIGSHEFLGNVKLDTIDSDKKINVVQYYSHPFRSRDKLTVQCANVIETDIKGCEGTVHLVDKVLIPPRGDVLDLLYQDPKFSRLVATLKEIGMAEELQTAESDITLFAPTNQAFEELETQESKWAFLQQHPDVFKQVLRHHIVMGTICCSGVYPSRWFIHPREQTLEGSTVILHRRQDDIFINRVPVQKCDTTATNGVVHALDNFLYESLRKYVPIRPIRSHHGWRSYWQRLAGLYDQDESEIDDLSDIEIYWGQRK